MPFLELIVVPKCTMEKELYIAVGMEMTNYY